MTRNYCVAVVFAILIVLFMPSLGRCNVQQENQDVLANSKIKKNVFEKVFRDIKKTLPEHLKKCPIIVTDITFRQRKYKYNNIAEEWTVDVCQERKVYFIVDESPYGGHYTVEPKEERMAREKKIWDAVKNDDKDGEWRSTLFYVDQLEAMDRDEKETNNPVK